MILIADSGSTKTHWCVVDDIGKRNAFFTSGINPFYQSNEDIRQIICHELLSMIDKNEIKAVFYYGAGFAFPEQKKNMTDIIAACLPGIMITVESDLLAAARGLFLNGSGIACILGTGSNSCYYNAGKIIKHVPPLGFILGDEGSGAVLGRRLVADCLKNQLEPELKDKFLQQYKLTNQLILDRVYKKAFPNRFLAGFTHFLLENLSHPQIYDIVYDELDRFIKRNVMQYSYNENKAGFTGSIAYYFASVLHEAAKENDISISEIVRYPIDGLVRFHLENRG